MAGIEISNLPATVTAQYVDVFPCDQAGPVTKKTTLAQVATLFNGNYVQLAPTGSQTITGSYSLSVPSGSIIGGNLQLSGNTLSSTNTNGNVCIIPNGSGVTSGLTCFGSTTNILPRLGNQVSVQLAANSSASTLTLATYLPTNTAPGIVFAKTRSTTINVHTAVAATDILGQISFCGDDGAAFYTSSLIRCTTEGTVSSGIVPSQLDIYTMNTSGVLSLAATITDAQIFTLSNPLPAGSGGTGVANTGTWTNGGNVTYSGAYTFTGTLTNTTSVTYPTSGTLATTAQTFPIVNTSGTTQAAAVNTGYVVGNSSTTSFTLPSTCSIGDRVSVIGNGAGGWVLTANTGQTIKIGSSTTASAGSLASTNQYDQIEVCCVVANTTWVTRSVLSSGVTVT